MDFPISYLAKKEWPPLLAEITDPPKQLYIRGTLPSFEYKWLAVVGSRNASPYGQSIATSLIAGLSGYPIVIVSGLALGIDGYAHDAALSSDLPCVAVPGSGLTDSVLYPRSHATLAKKILESGGALVSEYEPNFKAATWSFPKRNRIMAGLCHATLIIEANEKSGTLVTGRLAMEYNRDVLAVPGPIDSDLSHGPNRLIKDGATPIMGSTDILEALHIKYEEKSKVLPTLSPEEAEVIALLTIPLTRDDIIRSLSIPPNQALVLLSKMELSGLLVESGGVLRATIQ